MLVLYQAMIFIILHYIRGALLQRPLFFHSKKKYTSGISIKGLLRKYSRKEVHMVDLITKLRRTGPRSTHITMYQIWNSNLWSD